MVKSTLYKGIEFVRISTLPADQQAAMQTNFDSELFIKILIDETVASDCIQYKDYVAWYTDKFSKGKSILKTRKATSDQKELIEGF